MNPKIKDIPKTIQEIRSFPIKKVILGIDEDGKRLYSSFNSRHPKFPLVRKKTIGLALIDKRDFESSETYLKSVNGKNSAAYFSRKAAKNECVFKSINANDFVDEIDAIHISAGQRQGRSIDASYLDKITEYPADEHNLYFGVFKDEKLVAYLWIVRSGELLLMNRIMGHNDFLDLGIMYLLVTSFVQAAFEISSPVIMYDTLLGGGDGLKLFKKRCGFKPYRVKWIQQP